MSRSARSCSAKGVHQPVALGLGWVVNTGLEQVGRYLLVELVRQLSGVGPSGVTVGGLLAPVVSRYGVSR